MERRSLFSFIFGKKQPSEREQTISKLQMLNGYMPEFATTSNHTYDYKTARECIDRIATHCAKLMPKHIKNTLSQNIKGDINRLLSNQPNPIMNTYDFIYKTISMLYTDSNAFIFISKDKQGMITGFYPVLATTYELLQDKSGVIYLQFKFINGNSYTIPYLELIHLRLFYNKNDFFGTDNKVLLTDLETTQIASEGIKNAIKTSNNLKGILQFDGLLKRESIEKDKEAFVKDYLSLTNKSGIAALDGKAKFQEINLKPITLDKDQLEQVNYNIFDYYGVSEKIVRNNYSSEEWNAFYEGVIEPRAIQMSYEFTNKIFSDRAIREGNKIVFTTNRLQYASLSNKITLLKEAGALGLLTKDEAREIIDMSPLGGAEGSRIIQSLNNIDSSIANDYQSND